MKNNRIFKAWRAIDSTAGTYWQPDQADVWLALVSGIILGLVVAFQF